MAATKSLNWYRHAWEAKSVGSPVSGWAVASSTFPARMVVAYEPPRPVVRGLTMQRFTWVVVVGGWRTARSQVSRGIASSP